MKKARIGVVGTGHLGNLHTKMFSQIPNAELVGVFDSDAAKADAVASEHRTRSFPSLGELLDSVEAISIATTTTTHFDVARQALGRGIHTFIEKPITETIDQARSLVELAEKQRVSLQVGHIERFNPAILALEQYHIKPLFIESHRLAQFIPRGSDVAVVLDLMIHDIDLILSLVRSPVVRVDANGVSVVSGSEDIANARLQFENGCVANVTASRISQNKMRKMRLFQKNAYITIDFQEKQTEIYELGDPTSESDLLLGEMGIGEKKQKVFLKRPEIPDHNALLVELETFIKTIQGQSDSGVSGESARKALSVAIEILNQMVQ